MDKLRLGLFKVTQHVGNEDPTGWVHPFLFCSGKKPTLAVSGLLKGLMDARWLPSPSESVTGRAYKLGTWPPSSRPLLRPPLRVLGTEEGALAARPWESWNPSPT